MNDDILDEDLAITEETYEIGADPIYARKSVNQLIFSILIYVVFYIGSFFLPFFSDSFFGGLEIGILLIGFVSGLSVFLLNLFGMINASKSERYQERTSWKKYVGAVGNMLVFLPSVSFFLAFLLEGIYFFIEAL